MKQKTKDFVFKYRVIDGAIDIAGDEVVIPLSLEQVKTLVFAEGLNEDPGFDNDYADGLVEMIDQKIIDDAKVKYGDRVKNELYAYCDPRFDLPQTLITMKEWIKLS